MTSHEFDKILQRYLNDTCTVQEKRLVEEWFAAMGKSGEEIDLSERSAIKKRMWSKLDEPAHARPKRTYRFGYGQLSKIAAAILLLAVSAFLLLQYFNSAGDQTSLLPLADNMVHVVNSEKVMKKVALKDGSVISLQPGGEISFPEKFGTIREVYLSGEAFFEVARDVSRPFLVHANEVTTKVLGTSFLIKAYEQEKEVVVAVKTGRVSVRADKDGVNGSRGLPQEIILTPNQQVVYSREQNLVVKTLVEVPQLIVKKESVKTMYTNAPVTQIFQALEASYGVDIQYDEKVLSRCTLTSDMTEEGLYEQIAIVCNALGAHYSIEEMSIVVDAKGCR